MIKVEKSNNLLLCRDGSDLLKFKANIDLMAVLSQVKPG